MSYRYRIAGPESQQELTQLWRETFKQAYRQLHTPENINAYCERNFTSEAAKMVLSDSDTVCCIASRESQPSGFFVIQHHQCPIELGGPSSELKQIYVLSSEYGSGLGNALFEKARRAAKEAGGAWIWLCVSDTNYRAQAFYRKLKFEHAGSGPVFEVGTDRLASSIMALRL